MNDAAQVQGSPCVAGSIPDSWGGAPPVWRITSSTSHAGVEVRVVDSIAATHGGLVVYVAAWPPVTFRGHRILTLEEFAEADFPYPPETLWDED